MMAFQIKDIPELQGRILDVGGGGEGIIGRFFGNRVIAIDNQQEELDEAPDFCEKRLMDATCLGFETESFDTITFFYSLMYMDLNTQKQAMKEASRVLKSKGDLYVWDTDIPSAFPKPYVVQLEIPIESETIHTDYGIVKKDLQDSDSITAIARSSGLRLLEERKEENHFFLHFTKGNELP